MRLLCFIRKRSDFSSNVEDLVEAARRRQRKVRRDTKTRNCVSTAVVVVVIITIIVVVLLGLWMGDESLACLNKGHGQEGDGVDDGFS